MRRPGREGRALALTVAILALAIAVGLWPGADALARPLPPGPAPTAADLVARGCVDDNDTGGEDCAVSTDGLTAATGVVVSPDGNSVYATAGIAFADMAVVSFSRNPATGALTPLGCIDDVDVGPDACAQSTVGLDGASGIAVSPDGASVYVVSETDNALVRFARDPATGVLTPLGCVGDPDPTGDTPAATCAQNTDGLDVPKGVAVSADGLSVFVASFNDSALVRFDRDPASGALTPAGCIDDTESGVDTCAQSTIGLSGAFGGSSVALDRSGESLYVASAIDDAVAVFARNPATKGITPLGCIDDNDTGPDPCGQSTDGLDNVSGLTVTPDGNSVYATSQSDAAIVSFSRDPATGLLTPQGCIDDPLFGPDTCAQTAGGLGGTAVVVTADSRSVFTVARSGVVVGFERNPSSGALTLASCIRDNIGGPPRPGYCGDSAQALNNALDIAVSPDGNSAYVASQGDSAIQIFGLDPPDTALVAGPKEKTSHRLATFKFASEAPGATFACSRDGLSLAACISPKEIRVKPGKHTFGVVATDPSGNADGSPAEYQWKVTKH